MMSIMAKMMELFKNQYWQFAFGCV